MPSAMPTLIVEEDRVLRLVQIMLDPDTPAERTSAYADYMAHDVDLIAAYYHEQQNSFQGNGCSNNTFAACSGQLDAVSVVADYRFAKRFDVYAGAMFSKVSNGLASGFLNTSTIDPTVGLRFTF